MEKYIGVKIIEAEPMNLYEFSMNIKGVDCKEDNAEGYMVKYHDGYKSWSPKEIFKAAYFQMTDSDGSTVTQSMVDAFLGNVTDQQLDEKTTHVCADTLTGFRQHEVSSCVDPKNYDREIGTDIATGRVKNTLWQYLGFIVQWGRFGLRR